MNQHEYLSAIPPKKYKGSYSINNNEYNSLIQISEYPQKIFLTSSRVKEGEVYIVKELSKDILAEHQTLFFAQGVPHIKRLEVRVSIVDIIQIAKEVKGRKAVTAMTYKLGEVLPDNSVITSISSRWRQKKSNKTLEYIYKEFRKARA